MITPAQVIEQHGLCETCTCVYNHNRLRTRFLPCPALLAALTPPRLSREATRPDATAAFPAQVKMTELSQHTVCLRCNHCMNCQVCAPRPR